MDLLESQDTRGVVTLTIDRPSKRNAFDAGLIGSLTDAFRRVEDREDARVVVLTGAGENFCAGGDIGWMQSLSKASREANEKDARALGELFRLLDDLSKPTVAVIKGAAFGGGVGLVACCDIAIAANNARFSLSEVRLGLVPAVVGPYVIRAIGARHARALFLTGEVMGADQARRIGLVHETVEAELIDVARDRLIEELLRGAPGAQAEAKRLVRNCTQHSLDATLIEDTVRILSARRASREAAEGLSGYLEKRSPDWRAIVER